jgi:hypothetical protein
MEMLTRSRKETALRTKSQKTRNQRTRLVFAEGMIELQRTGLRRVLAQHARQLFGHDLIFAWLQHE